MLDIKSNAYQTYLGVCDDGIFFILDAFSGEAMGSFVLPRDKGEPIATFYCNHKMYIVFEKGEVAAFHFYKRETQFFGIQDPLSTITFFKNYYLKSCYVIVENERIVRVFVEDIKRGEVIFEDNIKVMSANVMFDIGGKAKKVIVIGNDANGEGALYLINLCDNKSSDAFKLYERIISSTQDYSSGEVQIETANESTIVIGCTEDDSLSLEYTEMKYHYVHNGKGLTSQKGKGIFFNEKLVIDDDSTIITAFGIENAVGFITEDNKFYCLDKSSFENN